MNRIRLLLEADGCMVHLLVSCHCSHSHRRTLSHRHCHTRQHCRSPVCSPARPVTPQAQLHWCDTESLQVLHSLSSPCTPGVSEGAPRMGTDLHSPSLPPTWPGGLTHAPQALGLSFLEDTTTWQVFNLSAFGRFSPFVSACALPLFKLLCSHPWVLRGPAHIHFMAHGCVYWLQYLLLPLAVSLVVPVNLLK